MSANNDTKIIYSGSEARTKLKNGVLKSCELVALTLGPSGSNIVIERQNDFPLTTNDGVRIVKRIKLEDEIENMGAEMVAKMAENTDAVGGDGTTTACVLLGALVSKILNDEKPINTINKYFQPAFNPMEVKQKIKESFNRVKQELQKMVKPISTPEDIKIVALVSSESDEISETIKDLFVKLGNDGQIIVDDSNGFTIESEIIDGYQIDVGLPAIHYANTSRQFCQMDSPLVLLTNEKLESPLQLDKILNEYSAGVKAGTSVGNKIVLFCEDYTVEFLASLITLKVKLGITILPLKVPAFKKGDIFEDLEAVTGAKLVDISKNESLINVGYDADVWGQVDSILIRHKDTIIKNTSPDISELIEKINKELKDNTQLTQHQITKLKERKSKLITGIGIIRVGAPTRTEQEYLRFKVDDTVNAVKAAIQYGVVPGAGLALKKINDLLPEEDILKGVINAPYNQIMTNCGGVKDVSENIVDPIKITENSLEKACSVASLIITTGAVIGIKKKERKGEEDDFEQDT